MELVEVKELFNGSKLALTSSRVVAEKFNKQHSHILRDIDKYINLSLANPKLDSLKFMFIESSYRDAQGKLRPEYLMNRDGFSFLVMSFTGQEAMEWKLKYIAAFNKLEEELINERYKNEFLSKYSNLKSITNILYKAQRKGKDELIKTMQIYKDFVPDDILELYKNELTTL